MAWREPAVRAGSRVAARGGQVASGAHLAPWRRPVPRGEARSRLLAPGARSRAGTGPPDRSLDRPDRPWN